MPPDLDSLELWLTIAALVAGAALAGAMVWLERKPRHSLEPHLVPTTPFLFIGAAMALVALVHLLNLFGIHTGRN